MIVEWLPRAVEQLLSIIDYVSEDSPAAAVALGQSIREKTTMLATYPTRYRTGRVRGTREMVVMPNYIVVYRIAGERVQILRVRHARQRR
ncbi:type II toxin-antitoxin system RelE/ParE family toxin [Paraburkholderia sp. JHI869]|uniref:type II toxin-antitoxin system RelE/ParE family toxin n=1 Tax=Paraburkholderia sp. JHI869 TaxID=3112959 RepID=UPI003172F92E